MTAKKNISRKHGGGHPAAPPAPAASDIMSVIAQLAELRDIKKDIANYADEDSYFSRVFHRCFELGPFVVTQTDSNAPSAGKFLSSTEGGMLVIRTGIPAGKYALRLKRFLFSEDGSVEMVKNPLPGDAVIWKVYFRNLDYPSSPAGSNMSIPEIIAAWDEFSPIFARLLETETANVDTIVKTLDELKSYLAPEILSDYATDRKGSAPGR